MSGKGDKKLRKEFNRRADRMLQKMIDDVRAKPFMFRLKFAWRIIKGKKKPQQVAPNG